MTTKTPLAVALAAMSLAATPLVPASAADQAGQFDFYVLALSWSPSWCAAHPDRNQKGQCDPQKNYGYIVHGLWPQNEHGFPQFCATREPDRVPFEVGKPYLDIIPSIGLIGHEWRKHGVCSGLKQADYFATIKKAYQAVTIPPALAHVDKAESVAPADIEKAFLAANPGMKAEGIAVACSGKMLEEVRICLNKDLSFRDCAEVDRKACSLSSIQVPPVP